MSRALARHVLKVMNEQMLRPADLIMLRRSYLHSLLEPRAERVSEAQADVNGAPPETVPRDSALAADDWRGLLQKAEGLCTPKPGLRMWVDLFDNGVSAHCMRGTFEPAETRFVEANLKPGDTFVDVGANIGWFTLHAARVVGEAGRVVAVEPRHDSHGLLTRSLAANAFEDFVEAHNAAAGDKPGSMRIGWARGTDNPAGTWSVTHGELAERLSARDMEYQDTPVLTLDALLGDSRVDLLKIDVEGAEVTALQGGRRMLERQRPVVLSEINAELLAEVGRTNTAGFLNWMAGLGYACHALEGDGGVGPRLTAETIPPGATVVNVVFLPEER